MLVVVSPPPLPPPLSLPFLHPSGSVTHQVWVACLMETQWRTLTSLWWRGREAKKARETALLRWRIQERRLGGGAEQSKAAGEPPKKTEPKPFLLSEGLPSVPAKLVGCILKGDFIDMAELLRDNLEAERRGVFQDSAGSSSSSHGRTRREVPDLLSWVQCFGLYTAVVGSQHPDRALKLLAYQTLIVREARRCGGRGWLTYDTVFRQQMAGEWKGDEWGRLNPYLYSSTFLTLGSSRLNCPLCLESDHREEDCALAKGKGVGTSRQDLGGNPSRRPPV